MLVERRAGPVAMVRLCVCYAASAAPSLEAQFGLFGGGPGSVFEANFRAYPVSFIDKVRSPRHAVRTALLTVHAPLSARQPDLENGDKGTRGSRKRLDARVAPTRARHAQPLCLTRADAPRAVVLPPSALDRLSAPLQTRLVYASC